MSAFRIRAHEKKKNSYRRGYRLSGCTSSDEIFSSVIEKMAVVCLLNLVCHSVRPSYLRFRVTPRLSASVSNIFLRFQVAGAVFIKKRHCNPSRNIRHDNFFSSLNACDNSDYNVRTSAMTGCGTTFRMLLDPWNLLAALVSYSPQGTI